MKTIGIIAALPEEADALFLDQGTRTGNTRHIRGNDRDIRIKICGIGKVNVAIAATNLIQTHGAELLIITGTAGALGERHGTFLLTEAIQADYGARRTGGFAHFKAGAWPIGDASCPPFKAMPVESPLPYARIATSDAFVECPDHAAYLRETLGCDLIDMETAAVAQVAEALGVPWIGIKSTTDDADGSSAGDFHANLLRASRDAARAAEEILHRV